MSNFEFGAPLKAGEGSSLDSLSSAPVLVEAVQPHVQPVLTTPPPLPHRSTSHTSTSAGSVPVIAPSEPSTVLAERLAAVKNDDPVIAARQVEKVRAAEREIKGRPVGGTIVKGIEDDRLYAMLRRFDVDITHVLHPASKLPPAEPDLRISLLPNLPSHSDVIKSNLERVIAAIGPSTVRGAREIKRLTSWTPEERIRTGGYALAYFIAWVFGYAVVGVCAFLAGVMCFPRTRRFLFPPPRPPPFVPISATDPTNQKGDESLIGAIDGTIEHKSKAEQAEEQAFEARSVIQAFTTRLIFDGRKKGRNAGNAQVGEKDFDPTSSSEGESDSDISDPAAVHGNLEGKDGVEGVDGEEKELTEKQKKKKAQKIAKKKRDELVSKMTKGTQDGLGAAADMIERLTNALSPPSCYPDRFARFKMAAAFLVPPALLFHYVPAWMFGRAASFGFGIAMFAQPVLIRAGKEALKRLPENWAELIDIRNSILSGVPTDAQLTLHLLRVAEALNNPLPRPPAPPIKGSAKEAIKDTGPELVTEDDDAEIEQAIEEGNKTDEIITKAKVKTKSHLKGAFKGLGKKMAGFRGDVAVDGKERMSIKERIGHTIDKTVFRGGQKDTGENDTFPAHLDGQSGYIILENRGDVVIAPQISFVTIGGKGEQFVWKIDDIVEIKKSHVTATRLALGWVSGADIEGLGLTIRFKTREEMILDQNKTAVEARSNGYTMEFSKVGRREELFVRLVSMGAQRWEVL